MSACWRASRGRVGIKFDDVKAAYTVGSVALALILFDGGLRTRLQTFRNVLAPAGTLATAGVLLTAALTAPAAVYTLGLGWTEGLLMGAAVASTDAAAVFFLLHARGLRLRPRVSATLKSNPAPTIRSPSSSPSCWSRFCCSARSPGRALAVLACREAVIGGVSACSAAVPSSGCSTASDLPQGLHAPFVATAALVVFGSTQSVHASGFLAVYIAGLVVGNRPTRAHNTDRRLPRCRDLARTDRRCSCVLGLLAWPERLPETLPCPRSRSH